jgi:hypothetical protein
MAGRDEESEAALASIAALQRRIRMLEYDHENLRQQSLQRQLVQQQEYFAGRHSALISASDRGQELLANLTETLSQIPSVREANAALKNQVEQSEAIFRGQKQKNIALKKRVKEVNANLNDRLSQLSAYEVLMGHLLSPPPQSTVLSADQSLIIASTGILDECLSDEVFHVHKELQDLPRTFRNQDLATKKRIVRSLAQAKDMCEDLCNEIKTLEKKKRNGGEIESRMMRLAQQQCLLSHDMLSFRFH